METKKKGFLEGGMFILKEMARSEKEGLGKKNGAKNSRTKEKVGGKKR